MNQDVGRNLKRLCETFSYNLLRIKYVSGGVNLFARQKIASKLASARTSSGHVRFWMISLREQRSDGRSAHYKRRTTRLHVVQGSVVSCTISKLAIQVKAAIYIRDT